ncbi:MAG: PAS domain-containing protein [Croceibacterium sp.]
MTTDNNLVLSKTADPVPAAHPFDADHPRFRGERAGDQFEGASGLLFEQAMAQTRMAVCLCDPDKPDFPIIFVNRAFRDLTGYDEAEVLGQNCRFLQGPDTDLEEIARIREAIRNEDVIITEVLNYREDGTPFWNALHLGPIYRADGKLIYLFGSQWDVTDLHTARSDHRHAQDMARELSHRMKNMFSVISGIVNITGRMRGVEKEAREINDRVQALGRAYETTLDDASSGHLEVGPAIRAILRPYDLDGHRVHFRGDSLKVPYNVVSGIGLTLHELAANATKHGAWTREGGEVAVGWNEVTEHGGRFLEVSWVERNGPPVTAPDSSQGTGNAIIDRLLSYGGGSIERRWDAGGFNAQVRFPLTAMTK